MTKALELANAILAQRTVPRPLGPRILVEEVVTSLSIRERGKRAGLEVITNDDGNQKDNATIGLILATGNDPLFVDEALEVGKVVYFDRYGGKNTFYEGRRYRTLMFSEITNVLEELPSDARLVNQMQEEVS